MRSQLAHVLQSESGAVTVDWVVLAAAVTGLGIGTVATVRTGTGSMADDINTSLSGASVAMILEEAYEFLRLSSEQRARLVLLHSSFSDSHLLEQAASIQTSFQEKLASGNLTAASSRVDNAYMLQQEIESRGLSLPDGFDGYRSLLAEYEAAIA